MLHDRYDPIVMVRYRVTEWSRNGAAHFSHSPRWRLEYHGCKEWPLTVGEQVSCGARSVKL
jgi:hypothetical protein